MKLFKKKNYIPIGRTVLRNDTVNTEEPKIQDEPIIPDGMWVKCRFCGALIYKKEMDEFKICPKCGGHFRISAKERLDLTVDEGSFQELFTGIKTENPLNFPGYMEKLDTDFLYNTYKYH